MSFTSTQPAVCWKLEVPVSKAPAESTILPDDGREGEESTFDDDERAPVDLGDIQNGGKYRSIVKIQACFNDKSTGKPVWMMGSGWLLRPDLIVTAGHVVYDWGSHFGATTQIKCYIGYRGRNSVPTSETDKNSNCQARYGKAVVTTTDWVSKVDNRPRDVAFIQVDREFTGNLRIIPYESTPSSDNCMLGVVGYPGDKNYKDPSASRLSEKGGEMYEQFKPTQYNLEKSARKMVEYRVSTFGGQSGAPILRKIDGALSAIGTHCYGGGNNNSGNAISGVYGNDYAAFAALFSGGVSTFGTPNKIKYLDIKKTPVVPPITGDETEGFMDVLRSVAKVGSVVLPLASSLLGPVGAMVGTAAGAMLATAAEAATVKPESYSGTTELAPGAAERALLAEASLQAVLLMHSPVMEEILDKMKANWTANAPNVDAIAPAVLPQLTECALDIATNKWSLISSGGPGTESAVDPVRQELETGHLPESLTASPEYPFVEALLGPTMPLADQPEGQFSSWFSSTLRSAVAAAKPLVTKAAKAAVTELVPKLVEKVTKSFGGAESVSSTPTPNEEAARILLKRAVMADIALQALMSLPEEELQSLTVEPPDGGEPEGIFDFIKTVVQKIGPVALDTAKKAVQQIAPVLIEVASNSVPRKPIASKPITGGLKPTKPMRTIERKQSLIELLSGGDGTVKVSSLTAVNTPLEASVGISSRVNSCDSERLPQIRRRKSWDSNEDLPIFMQESPPDF